MVGARLALDPGASPDRLASDLLCLLDSGVEVFEAIAFEGDADRPLHPLHWSGLYLLRQARIVARALQAAVEQDGSTAEALKGGQP